MHCLRFSHGLRHLLCLLGLGPCVSWLLGSLSRFRSCFSAASWLIVDNLIYAQYGFLACLAAEVADVTPFVGPGFVRVCGCVSALS